MGERARPRARHVAIYALCDIESGAVVYVGATHDLLNRIRKHRCACDDMTGAWVRQMVKEKKEFGFLVVDLVKPRHADAAETKWIRFYAARGPLLNRRGLKGDSNYMAATAELREAIRAAGQTIRGLGELLHCTGPTLLKANSGLIPIHEKLAIKVQEATRSTAYPEGFRATRDNWPRLRAA